MKSSALHENDFIWMTGFFPRDKRNFAAYIERIRVGADSREPPLDENICSLVKALNELPFLYTMGSGGGYVVALFREDNLVYGGGCWVTFTADGFSRQSALFVTELGKLLQTYKDAHLKPMPQTSSDSYEVTLAVQEDGEEVVAYAGRVRVFEMSQTL
mgnify:CR=1 FL=1